LSCSKRVVSLTKRMKFDETLCPTIRKSKSRSRGKALRVAFHKKPLKSNLIPKQDKHRRTNSINFNTVESNKRVDDDAAAAAVE
jgi:hypothetical protein